MNKCEHGQVTEWGTLKSIHIVRKVEEVSVGLSYIAIVHEVYLGLVYLTLKSFLSMLSNSLRMLGCSNLKPCLTALPVLSYPITNCDTLILSDLPTLILLFLPKLTSLLPCLFFPICLPTSIPQYILHESRWHSHSNHSAT